MLLFVTHANFQPSGHASFLNLTGIVLRPYIYGQNTHVQSHTHKIATVATSLAQRCTSLCCQSRACFRTLGTNTRSIVCLLDGVSVEVQPLHWVAHQWLVLGSSFCGCGSSNPEPPGHGNSRRKRSITYNLICDFGK